VAKRASVLQFPSLTDKTAAPEGMESGFLVPLAPGINDSEELREEYFNKIDRFEHLTQCQK
jgi:phytoene desaturase